MARLSEELNTSSPAKLFQLRVSRACTGMVIEHSRPLLQLVPSAYDSCQSTLPLSHDVANEVSVILIITCKLVIESKFFGCQLFRLEESIRILHSINVSEHPHYQVKSSNRFADADYSVFLMIFS